MGGWEDGWMKKEDEDELSCALNENDIRSMSCIGAVSDRVVKVIPGKVAYHVLPHGPIIFFSFNSLHSFSF
jgi:hypothetical protein